VDAVDGNGWGGVSGGLCAVGLRRSRLDFERLSNVSVMKRSNAQLQKCRWREEFKGQSTRRR
jgi:hypothetical protein